MKRILSLAASVLIGASAALIDVAVAHAQSVCADFGGNVQSGNLCRVFVSTPSYNFNVRYRMDYADEGAVTKYLTEERDRVINLADAPGAQRLPYTLYVTSQLYASGQPPRHGTQSLVLKIFADVEGAPVGFRFKSFTFDLNQNRAVTFENLFAPGTNPMDAIYKAVATDLERQRQDRNFELAPSVGLDPAHYRNFAVTDDTVVFFFDAGEFMIREAGELTVTLPRALLPPLQL